MLVFTRKTDEMSFIGSITCETHSTLKLRSLYVVPCNCFMFTELNEQNSSTTKFWISQLDVQTCYIAFQSCSSVRPHTNFMHLNVASICLDFGRNKTKPIY